MIAAGIIDALEEVLRRDITWRTQTAPSSVSGSDEELDHERGVLGSIVDVASAVAPASARFGRSSFQLAFSRVRLPVSQAPASADAGRS